MIRTTLMGHQKQIVSFIRDKEYFGIFADFGTGKTLCALSYINFHRLRKVLIVSTKTAVQSTWVDEILKHTDFIYTMLIGTRSQKINNLYIGLKKSMINAGYYHSSKDHIVLFLINFDGVENIFNELVQANFDLIIMDESTKCKSPKTKRTMVLWKLAEHIDKRCIMTGFPITESLVDLYSQIKFLDLGENFGNSYYAFIHRYFNKIAYKCLPRKKGVIEILKKIKPFCIRITNAELKLPPKNYKIEHVKLTEDQSKLLTSLEEYFRLEFGKAKIDTQYVFALINKSLQICAGFIKGDDIKDDNGKILKKGYIENVPTNKDEMLAELLEEINIYQHKVIIWCTFLHTVEKLNKMLKAFSPLTLSGATKNVNEVVNQFQHDKNSNVLIAIQKKASESITLTSCAHCIYYSNGWSADLRLNSEARIRRKGSEHHKFIFYIDLITKDTIEEKVISCLREKKNLIEELKVQFDNYENR